MPTLVANETGTTTGTGRSSNNRLTSTIPGTMSKHKTHK